MIFPVRLGGFYVSFLRALVSADQQQHHLIGVVGKLARSGLRGLIVSYTIRGINRKDNRTFAE